MKKNKRKDAFQRELYAALLQRKKRGYCEGLGLSDESSEQTSENNKDSLSDNTDIDSQVHSDDGEQSDESTNESSNKIKLCNSYVFPSLLNDENGERLDKDEVKHNFSNDAIFGEDGNGSPGHCDKTPQGIDETSKIQHTISPDSPVHTSEVSHYESYDDHNAESITEVLSAANLTSVLSDNCDNHKWSLNDSCRKKERKTVRFSLDDSKGENDNLILPSVISIEKDNSSFGHIKEQNNSLLLKYHPTSSLKKYDKHINIEMHDNPHTKRDEVNFANIGHDEHNFDDKTSLDLVSQINDYNRIITKDTFSDYSKNSICNNGEEITKPEYGKYNIFINKDLLRKSDKSLKESVSLKDIPCRSEGPSEGNAIYAIHSKLDHKQKNTSGEETENDTEGHEVHFCHNSESKEDNAMYAKQSSEDVFVQGQHQLEGDYESSCTSNLSISFFVNNSNVTPKEKETCSVVPLDAEPQISIQDDLNIELSEATENHETSCSLIRSESPQTEIVKNELLQSQVDQNELSQSQREQLQDSLPKASELQETSSTRETLSHIDKSICESKPPTDTLNDVKHSTNVVQNHPESSIEYLKKYNLSGRQKVLDISNQCNDSEARSTKNFIYVSHIPIQAKKPPNNVGEDNKTPEKHANKNSIKNKIRTVPVQKKNFDMQIGSYQEAQLIDMTTERNKSKERPNSEKITKQKTHISRSDLESTGRKRSTSLQVPRSFHQKRSLSPYSQNLYARANEKVVQPHSAHDLRTAMFEAWCEVKSQEAQTLLKEHLKMQKCQEEKHKEKIEKTMQAQQAYKSWKNKKQQALAEKAKKLQNDDEAKLKQEREMEEKKNAEMAFQSWKMKKDNILKENLHRQKIQLKQKERSLKEAKHNSQEDASAAFRAWKQQKILQLKQQEEDLHLIRQQGKQYEILQKIERDNAALEAFELWLLYKEQDKGMNVYSSHINDRLPWSPPGKCT